MNETVIEKDLQYSGQPFENAVRMSFVNGNIIDKELLDKIAAVVKNEDE